jgi:MSHA biogenesis protein MshI
VGIFSNKSHDELVVVSIDGQHSRLQLFNKLDGKLCQAAAVEFDYENLEALEDNLHAWCKKNNIKNSICRWLLSHECYQTYLTDSPNVLKKELPEALKWQLKDQLDFPVDEVLISYYKPHHPDPENNQVVAVSVEKKLIDTIVLMTKEIGLELNAIEVEELTIGHMLIPHLAKDKIVGYVGENRSGLVFNFYQSNKLVFSRYKKGTYLPINQEQEHEFSLESQSQEQEDAFLLETQRTLDYVISQLFRKPVDLILLQNKEGNTSVLAETINQLIETPVSIVESDVDYEQQENLLTTTLAEAGCAVRLDN